MAGAAAAFDSAAARYDELWTNSRGGRLQRDAVWRNVEMLFGAGDSVLDLGCGTGEDAAWLLDRGVRVTAIDASAGMVARARQRGIDAHVGAIERTGEIRTSFDGILSNFGAFNCIEGPQNFSDTLGRLLPSGGCFALCTLGRFCLWETLWYALHGKFAKAVRRWTGKARAEALGVDVYYWSVDRLRRAFESEFELVSVTGVGIAVPPSFVTGIPPWLFRLLGSADRAMERLPWLAAIADHRLLIFVRK